MSTFCDSENCDVNAVDIDGRTPLHVLSASSTWLSNVSNSTGNKSKPPAVDSTNHKLNGNISTEEDIELKPATASNVNDSGNDNVESLNINHDSHSGVHLEDHNCSNGDNSAASCHTKQGNNSTVGVTKKLGLTLVTDSRKICHQSTTSSDNKNGTRKKDERTGQRLYNDHFETNSSSNKKNDSSSAHGHIMKILLRAGANANRVDEYNDTPLHICALRGNLEGVKILLEHGANYDLVDNMCETALTKAIIHHRASVVKCLLRCQCSMPEMKRYELSELIFTIIEDLSNNTEEKDEKEVVDIIR